MILQNNTVKTKKKQICYAGYGIYKIKGKRKTHHYMCNANQMINF